MATIKEIVKNDFLKIDKEETIGKLLGKLHKEGERNALVFDGGRFVGIVRKMDLLRSKEPVEEMKVARVVKPVATISEDMDMLEAAYIMFNVDTNILPVEKSGKIVGVVNIFDVIAHVPKYEPVKHFTIREVKYEGVVGVDEEERIGAALHLMHEMHTYDLPVLHGGKLTGIISVSDIFNKYVARFPAKSETRGTSSKEQRTRMHGSERPSLHSLAVKNFDTSNEQYTLEETQKLGEAAAVMSRENVMCVIVMKNKKMIGVLTANDILRALAALYVGPQFNIWITGIKKTKLEPYQVSNIRAIVASEATKLRHYFDGDFGLRVRVKSYGKGGKREKYSITMQLESAGRKVTSDEHDWDIETAIHKNFANLRNRLKHIYRNDSQHDKGYER